MCRYQAPLLALVFLSLLPLHPNSLPAQEQTALWPELAKRTPWVFLGDSNTYSGRYVGIIDAWLDSANVVDRPQVLNLGVSSETAAGTSEVDHPFKRPCVHERLDKTLAITRPGVVFVCYGMNDGIYEPFNPEVFAAYQRGMLELSAKIRATGAKLVVLTPPIFEAQALVQRNRRFGPNANNRYAYNAPFKDYDQVMARMSEWCLTNAMQADCVVDVRSLMLSEQAAAKESNSQETFSNDGVHFGNVAHALVAEAILQGIGAPEEIVASYPSEKQVNASYKKVKRLRDAYLSAVGKNRPSLPAGLPLWHALQ